MDDDSAGGGLDPRVVLDAVSDTLGILRRASSRQELLDGLCGNLAQIAGIEAVRVEPGRFVESRTEGAETWLPLTARERSFGALVIMTAGPRALDAGLRESMARLAREAAWALDALDRRFFDAEADESERLYRALIELSPDIVTVGQGGIIRFINEPGARVLGRTVDETIGMNAADLLEPAQLERFGERLRQLDEGRPVGPLDFRVYLPDGSSKIIEVSSVPIRYRGEAAVMSVGRDVTERNRSREALRRATERAQRYLDVAEAAIVELDERGHIVRLNEHGAELLGVGRHQARGRSWFEHFVPEVDRERVRAEFLRLIDSPPGMGVQRFENEIVRADGVTRLVTWRNMVMRDDDGRAVGTLSSGIDVTEERLAQAALKEREARLQTIFSNAPFGIARVSVDAEILGCNARLAAMLGYEPEELVGRSAADITHPDDLVEDFALSRRVLSGEQATYSIEKRYLRRDGTVLHAELSMSVVRDPEGRVMFGIGFINDISQRKRAELAQRESEARYRTLFEAAKDAIVVFEVGDDDTLVDANPTTEAMLGYSRDALLQMAPWDFSPPLQADRRLSEAAAREHIRLAVERGAHAFEWRHRRADGTDIDVEVTLGRLELAGRTHVMGIVRDVTERHELERQVREAQKMEAIGRLAGGVAHDFNNLLTVIIGWAHILMQESGEEASEPIQEIIRTSESATALTQQLLAFARRQIVQPRDMEINGVVERATMMMQRLVGERVKLHALLAPDLPPVFADPGQIEQVLMNLVVNARDAMPEGGMVTLSTEARQVDAAGGSRFGVDAGEYVAISVEDTGVGMDAETVERVFDPFFTTKGEGEGTGLGLSTVHGIVRQSRGGIRIESTPGKGTRVTVLLPRAAQSVEAPAQREARVPTGDETVLIVEDEPRVREVTARLIRKLGYDVLVADGGPAALKICDEHERPIHVLLTDVVMPEMNGPEVARGVRARRPETRVLYMSGYATEDQLPRDLQKDAPLLHKPIRWEVLAQALRDAINSR